MLVTPTRTLVYRAEGLLSDESVSAYPHDVQRVEIRTGRRKTTFRLAYVDGVKDFTVPAGSTHQVLVPLLSGVLRTAGVIEADESVRGAYRFSELTLVVTDRRVVKHVGGAVWDEEFEVAPYADLTGLRFEEGAVGTEIEIEVDGYPQRVKVPNEHAGTVRRTIQEAVFAFHDVSSLTELEDVIAPEEEEGNVLEESGFTQLLEDDEGEDDEDAGTTADAGGAGTADAVASDDPFGTDEEGETILGRVTADFGTGTAEGEEGADTADEGATDAEEAIPPEIAARLDDLAAAVERQNELLERQGEIIQQLVRELRQGR